MMYRRAILKAVCVTAVVWISSQSTASAQYNWTVTSPTTGGTYSKTNVPIEVTVTWIPGFSTAISNIGVKVLQGGTDVTNSVSVTTSTTGNSCGISGKASATVTGVVTIEFDATDSSGNVRAVYQTSITLN